MPSASTAKIPRTNWCLTPLWCVTRGSKQSESADRRESAYALDQASRRPKTDSHCCPSVTPAGLVLPTLTSRNLFRIGSVKSAIENRKSEIHPLALSSKPRYGGAVAANGSFARRLARPLQVGT